MVSRGTATVALSDESQTLNLRAAPTTNAAVLSRLRHGQTLTVLERYANWTYVQYGTLSGYVMNDYVVYDAGDSDSDAPSGDENGGEDSGENGGGQAAAQVAIVLPSDGLNLRAGANTASGVIMVLPQGTMLTVTGEMRDNGMLPVLLGSVAGYVSSDYVYVTDEALATATPAISATPTPHADPAAGSGPRAGRAGGDGSRLRRPQAAPAARYVLRHADDDAPTARL